jgi:hypothetical protein
MKNDIFIKCGYLVQHGVDFMIGFNENADAFVSAYNTYLPEVIEEGYSQGWSTWLRQNKNLVSTLFDDLSAANKIP